MPEPEAFYEEILYALQNGVLRTLAASGAPFYLTGGTALHRHHFGYRYSEDLDLFVNRDPDFGTYLDRALAALRAGGFRFDPEAAVRDRHYARVLIRTPEAALKLDFVDDTAPHFGGFVGGALFPRIDSLRNILSNKLTALGRLDPKDVADLWAISRHHGFAWSPILAEAGAKEMGFDGVEAADLIRSFPDSLFEAIRWRRRPDRQRFFQDLETMAGDLLSVGENSLHP